MAEPLTDRQRAVLGEIARFYRDNGEPPSLRYLARRFRIDHKTVREHVEALHRKGWLRAPSTGGVHCTHPPNSVG